MKLIDVNEVYNLIGQSGVSRIHVSDIDRIRRIDPETLHIVQELKKQLEQVNKERDSAIKYLKVAVGETGNCYGCKWLDEETGKCKNEIAKYECNYETNDMWEWKG